MTHFALKNLFVLFLLSCFPLNVFSEPKSLSENAVHPPADATKPPGLKPAPASQPAKINRLAQLQERIKAELHHPALSRIKISLLAVLPEQEEPLIAVEPDAHRLPASNAKLLTSTAAALTLPGHYRFVSELSNSKAGGPIYLWGTGDPLLGGADLHRMAGQVRAAGIKTVRGIFVDDSYFDRTVIAPGFEAFAPGANYRPICGAVNVQGNAVHIKVIASSDDKRPQVEVTPLSEAITVRKFVRYSRAKRGPALTKVKIKASIRPSKNGKIRVNISGIMGRKAKTWTAHRAVLDPALHSGWVLRKALVEAGIRVTGMVKRGNKPPQAKVLARRQRSLEEILLATNQQSDNLSAETLVRAMSFVPLEDPNEEKEEGEEENEKETKIVHGSWTSGLKTLSRALNGLGLSNFYLGNGSGLHRRSWVTARTMVHLLEQIYANEKLNKLLIPTLAVAGQKGTLAGRMRGTAAEGMIHAKTGTLGGARSLSGIIDPKGKHPLIFSILMNGHKDLIMRDRIDRIAVVLARYIQGLPMMEEPSEETPSSQPSTDPDETENGTDPSGK